MRLVALFGSCLALAAGGAAQAAVIDAQPAGFQVEQKVELAAPADRVWAALGNFGLWWDAKHSFSGDARNYKLDLSSGAACARPCRAAAACGT
jgi:hypothetical protein